MYIVHFDIVFYIGFLYSSFEKRLCCVGKHYVAIRLRCVGKHNNALVFDLCFIFTFLRYQSDIYVGCVLDECMLLTFTLM